MGFKAHWDAWPLSRRLFISIVALVSFIVILVEGLLEPIVEDILFDTPQELSHFSDFDYYEIILWVVSILVPAFVAGGLLTRLLSNKINKLAKAAQSIARGNLSVRLPVTNNEQDAFDVLTCSFNSMASSLERLMHNERKLLADISHELRAPLSRMRIAVALLQRTAQDEKGLELTDRLEKEICSMDELVNLLLTQAKDSLGAHRMERLCFSTLLADVAADFTFQASALHKEVACNVTSNLYLKGNVALLQRLFANIISNALFYAPEKTAVRISAVREDRGIVVRIQDSGPGVPETMLEEIFRAFFRVDESRARTGGSVGLGLAMAKDAATLHQGEIFAENTHPGLRITVILPEASLSLEELQKAE